MPQFFSQSEKQNRDPDDYQASLDRHRDFCLHAGLRPVTAAFPSKSDTRRPAPCAGTSSIKNQNQFLPIHNCYLLWFSI